MRGKAFLCGRNLHLHGITPAHAGKSCRPARRWSCPRDHPRTCGEKLELQAKLYLTRGSPPHMRGKVKFLLHVIGHLGITPAHAGKSRWQIIRRPWNRDHPRTCGEKVFVPGRAGMGAGSPPHMRGKSVRTGQSGYGRGITPAHAGKSCLGGGIACIVGDHPRACGEKTTRENAPVTMLGSPPHMRGKDFGIPAGRPGPGITPAHAGKSNTSYVVYVGDRDHPRTCGEKFYTYL